MTRRTTIGALICSVAMVLTAPWLATAETVTWNIVFDPTFLQPLTLVGVGDVDGDRVSDLIWRDPATGEVLIALTHPDESFPLSSITPIHVATIPDLNWEVAGVGDLNADGREDLVWVNRSTQRVVVWLMNGMTIDDSYFLNVMLPIPPAGHRWKLLAVKDISGNGQPDLLWTLD
jgi:hypothetical protein